jgi:hypothetical protein
LIARLIFEFLTVSPGTTYIDVPSTSPTYVHDSTIFGIRISMRAALSRTLQAMQSRRTIGIA